MIIKNLAFFGVMASIFAVSAAQALDTPATRIATVGYVKSNAAQADYNDTTTQLGASTIQGAIEAIAADVADLDQTASSAIHTLTDGNTTGSVVTNVTESNGTITVTKGDLAYSNITGTPTLATVATTGAYSDLTGAPTIPTVDQTYGASSTNAQSGTAVAEAVSGAVNTINSTIGTVPNGSTVMAEIQSAAASGNVQSDWSATTGDAVILNKPTLATVATTGAYSDLTGTPTIPTLPNGVNATGGTGTTPVISVTQSDGQVTATNGTITYDAAMSPSLPHFDTPNTNYANGDCTDAMPCVLTFTGSKYVWTALDIPAAAQSGGGN